MMGNPMQGTPLHLQLFSLGLICSSIMTIYFVHSTESNRKGVHLVIKMLAQYNCGGGWQSNPKFDEVFSDHRQFKCF